MFYAQFHYRFPNYIIQVFSIYLPKEIDKTEMYVETKLTPDEILKTAKALLAEFGYSQDKLRINAE